MYKFKFHFTHKLKIRKLYKDGFCEDELAIMYKVNWSDIKRIVTGLQKPERI